MANFNVSILDGYVLNPADGYSFTTKWIDVKNALAYSISINFLAGSGGTATGTLTLQCSNESDVGSPMGGVQGTQPTNGPQPFHNGLDAFTVTSSSKSIIANGVSLYDISFPGYRWVRVVFAGTSASNGCKTNIWTNVKW